MSLFKQCHFPADLNLFRDFSFKKSMKADWDFDSLKKLDSQDLCFANFLDLKPVSFILGRMNDYVGIGTFEIHFIATDSNEFKRGFMASLWTYFIYRLKVIGCSELVLEVHEKNEVAINFYRQRGFYLFKSRESYYKDGAKALELKLDISV